METLSEQLEEKIEESQELARDAVITVRRHMSPLRGKRWVIHNWGLVRTCVGILRVPIRMSFGVFLQFLFYSYNYNCELYMFDELVDVPMKNYCEIDVFLCWVWTL